MWPHATVVEGGESIGRGVIPDIDAVVHRQMTTHLGGSHLFEQAVDLSCIWPIRAEIDAQACLLQLRHDEVRRCVQQWEQQRLGHLALPTVHPLEHLREALARDIYVDCRLTCIVHGAHELC